MLIRVIHISRVEQSGLTTRCCVAIAACGILAGLFLISNGRLIITTAAKMFSTLAAILLTQQVLTQSPSYAALLGLCPEPPKHTMIVIPAPQTDGTMPIEQGDVPNATDASLRSRDGIHQ